MESKYLRKFKQIEKRLNGSRMLVEVLPKREIKTAGGLLLATPNSHKATADSYRAVLGVVLMIGEGYVGPNGEDVPMETKIGDIVLLNEFGMKFYSEFPGLAEYTSNTVAMTSEAEVQLKFSGFEELKQFEDQLNQV